MTITDPVPNAMPTLITIGIGKLLITVPITISNPSQETTQSTGAVEHVEVPGDTTNSTVANCDAARPKSSETDWKVYLDLFLNGEDLGVPLEALLFIAMAQVFLAHVAVVVLFLSVIARNCVEGWDASMRRRPGRSNGFGLEEEEEEEEWEERE